MEKEKHDEDERSDVYEKQKENVRRAEGQSVGNEIILEKHKI